MKGDGNTNGSNPPLCPDVWALEVVLEFLEESKDSLVAFCEGWIDNDVYNRFISIYDIHIQLSISA